MSRVLAAVVGALALFTTGVAAGFVLSADGASPSPDVEDAARVVIHTKDGDVRETVPSSSKPRDRDRQLFLPGH